MKKRFEVYPFRFWILFVICFLGFGIYAASAQHEGHDMNSMPGMSAKEHKKMLMEEGKTLKADQVKISPERQQLIGVKTETARKIELKSKLRTVGTVAYDPDLYAAQNEYVEALKTRDEGLVSAARLKLKRLGLSSDLIQKIRKADPSLLVGSQKGRIWIYGKIYENEISLIKTGMTVHVTARSLPGKMFMGKIASIDSVLDEMTRSLKIRVSVLNDKGMLKPNMFVDLLIEAPLGKRLAVPEEAVMDTGERQIIFVDKGDGVFEKRKVTVGQKADGMVEIISGLKAGEKIVTSGTFLIDSESKLRSTGGGGHVH
jgi:Cu(I)/Ag(I) efflux system membrane fusion protein